LINGIPLGPTVSSQTLRKDQRRPTSYQAVVTGLPVIKRLTPDN